MSKPAWISIALLTTVIAIAAVALVVVPAPANGPTLEEPGKLEPFVSENVIVSSPEPGSTVAKTFTVVGEARGPWYFEASFPIFVADARGTKVGQGIAMTASEWMTTEFVPFSAEVVVEDYSGPATLSLLKDNPSGLPEHDDAVSFSIMVE